MLAMPAIRGGAVPVWLSVVDSGNKRVQLHTSSRPKEPALLVARNQSLVMTIKELTA